MSTIRSAANGASRDSPLAAEQPPNPLPLGGIPPQHVKKATQRATGVRVYELQPHLPPRLERLPHIRVRPLRRYEP